MKLGEHKSQEEYDVGFKVPSAGDYNWQIIEPVESWKDENDPTKYAIRIPATVVDAVGANSDKEAIGGKATVFCMNNKFGEETLAALLDLTGLMAGVVQKFGGDADINALIGNPDFLQHLKLKMPGKVFGATHTVSKNKSKKTGDELENVNFKKYRKVGSQPASGGTPVSTGGQKSFED